MGIETKTHLNEETLDKLQDLIRMNIDSEDGFQEAAQQVEDSNLSAVFTELAAQRRQFASQLQDYVEWNGEKPRDEGSYAAAFHRTWMGLRSMLSSNDSHAVLKEVEKGEDHIKDAYEDALQDTTGSAMNDVLIQQYAGIKAGHDRIRDLRDHYAGQ